MDFSKAEKAGLRMAYMRGRLDAYEDALKLIPTEGRALSPVELRARIVLLAEHAQQAHDSAESELPK